MYIYICSFSYAECNLNAQTCTYMNTSTRMHTSMHTQTRQKQRSFFLREKELAGLGREGKEDKQSTMTSMYEDAIKELIIL